MIDEEDLDKASIQYLLTSLRELFTYLLFVAVLTIGALCGETLGTSSSRLSLIIFCSIH